MAAPISAVPNMSVPILSLPILAVSLSAYPLFVLPQVPQTQADAIVNNVAVMESAALVTEIVAQVSTLGHGERSRSYLHFKIGGAENMLILAVNILAVHRPLSLYVVSKSVVYTLSVLFRGLEDELEEAAPGHCGAAGRNVEGVSRRLRRALGRFQECAWS